MGLGMDVELFDKDGKVIDMDSLARQTQQEEQRSLRSLRNIGNESSSSMRNSDDIEVDDSINLNDSDMSEFLN